MTDTTGTEGTDAVAADEQTSAQPTATGGCSEAAAKAAEGALAAGERSEAEIQRCREAGGTECCPEATGDPAGADTGSEQAGEPVGEPVGADTAGETAEDTERADARRDDSGGDVE